MPVTASWLKNILFISDILNHHLDYGNLSTVNSHSAQCPLFPCDPLGTRLLHHTSWNTHQPPGFGNSGGFPLTGNKKPDQKALSPHNYSPFGHISVGAAIRFQYGTQFPNLRFLTFFYGCLLNKQCIKISPGSNDSVIQLASASVLWRGVANRGWRV